MTPLRGFTLLELLVVLVLMGMVAGMVGPRFFDIADKLRHRNEWNAIGQLINGLPLDAQYRQQTQVIDQRGLASPSLPDGWRITAATPLVYQANGVCLGGEIAIWRGEALLRKMRLEAPYCQWQAAR